MTDEYAHRELDDEIAEFDEASVVDETAEPAEPPDEEPLEFEDSTGESLDRKLEREEPEVEQSRPERDRASAEEAAMHEESANGRRRGR